jgi:phenylalanyl-tRNA synthetase beta chain
MKVSLNWIKEYLPGVKFEATEELTEKMINAGLDIEGIEDQSEIFKNFVIGKVIEKQKHPNADKLSVCKVDIGNKILNIVCGAPNVDKGQKVCVAIVGAVIPDGGFEIKKTKIRGEISEGMICSEKELNISDDYEGILVLNDDAVTGERFSDYSNSNDIVFDIGITPNRGDLFSHIGMAREIGAIYDHKVKKPEIKIKESGEDTHDLIKIKIENTDMCKRFTGRVIKNVEIKESPDWLKKKLTAIGLRPRNNIVDITNYVMMETGQPLHAFDYDKIIDKLIIVKTAKDGEKFITLDSKERTLNDNSLMICDAKGYSGIAGVMGGEFSEITNDTKNVFLEVAYFDPVSIRKNSKKLGLQTDASQRFERGVDIENVEYASLRATELINELAGGEVSKGLYDVYPEKFERLLVPLRVKRANEIIGIDLHEDEVVRLLYKIDILFLRKENDDLVFEIPEFRRHDIQREIDLIEEVARLYGYQNIHEDQSFRINTGSKEGYDDSIILIRDTITDFLIGRGFNQIVTVPLVDKDKESKFSTKFIEIENPNSVEMNAMRSNLSHGMLNVIRNNYHNSGKDISIKLFETGRVFLNEKKKFNEEDHLCIGLSGRRDEKLIYGGDRKFDIFDIKGEVEMLLFKLNLENYRLFYYNNQPLKEQKIEIALNDEPIGNIYKADKEILKDFEIEEDVYIAEIRLPFIYKNYSGARYYSEISKFPVVKRDLALLASVETSYQEIDKKIRQSAGEYLKSLEVFDIYTGERIGNNKKSLAFTLSFSSIEKTLTDEEVNKVIEKIIKDLEKDLNVTLRN